MSAAKNGMVGAQGSSRHFYRVACWLGLIFLSYAGPTWPSSSIAAWFGSTPGQQENQEELQRVTAVFHAYKAALTASDGVAAARLVDAKTFEYFGQLKELAMHGDEETVKARPFIDRLLVISMRQVFSVDALEVLELGELMNKAVSEGWISPQTVSQLEIGEVSIVGDRATAQAVSLNPAVSLSAGEEEEEGSLNYRFVREGGEWKFGFASLVSSLNRLVEEFTAQLGTDQDELIFMLVQSLTGKPVLPGVWQRPARAAGQPRLELQE